MAKNSHFLLNKKQECEDVDFLLGIYFAHKVMNQEAEYEHQNFHRTLLLGCG